MQNTSFGGSTGRLLDPIRSVAQLENSETIAQVAYVDARGNVSKNQEGLRRPLQGRKTTFRA